MWYGQRGCCLQQPFPPEILARSSPGSFLKVSKSVPGPVVSTARSATIGAGVQSVLAVCMTEFTFPWVSVSNSGGEYFQVCFGDDEDSEEAYLLIQRQFEDCDGGYFYVESSQECLCGHFKIRRAELSRDVLRLEIMSRPVETVQIRFRADDAHYEQLKQILSIMIPADVFNVVP